jgi:transmembrane 9 superfamily protein 2/4
MPEMLSIFCGMGTQVGFMLYLLVGTLFVGLISPYTRYYVFIYGYITLTVGSVFNGYVTARMMRILKATDWRTTALISSITLPLYILITFVLVDFVEYEERSQNFVPLTSLALFALIWFILSVPLALYGSYRG